VDGLHLRGLEEADGALRRHGARCLSLDRLGRSWKIFGWTPNTVTNDLQTIPAANILAAGTFGRGTWEILLAPKKKVKPEKPKPPKKPAPKLRRAPVSDPYFHVSEMNILPGRLPGQPLVNPEKRKKQRRK
jgi:hypothetical protein